MRNGASGVRPGQASRTAFQTDIFTGVALLLALAPGLAVAQNTPGRGWDSHVTVSGKAGDERQLGEVEVFMPLWQDNDSLLFGDLRGQYDADGNLEGNIGLGYRQQFGDAWIVGGYGFFDWRRTDETGNTFMQATFGIEALSEDWDLRANIYIPEDSEKEALGVSEAELVGASIQLRLGQERALPGADAEIGYRMWGSGSNS